MPIQVDLEDLDELELLENHRKSKISKSTLPKQKVKQVDAPQPMNASEGASEGESEDDEQEANDNQIQKPKAAFSKKASMPKQLREAEEGLTGNVVPCVRGKPGPKPDKQYVRSEKQKEVTNRMREKLTSFQEQQRKEKEEKQAAEKKRKEDKIVAKALSIKKKQIKKEAVLDEVSDDDSDIEEIKEIVRKKKSVPINIPKQTPVQVPIPQKPIIKYRFV